MPDVEKMSDEFKGALKEVEEMGTVLKDFKGELEPLDSLLGKISSGSQKLGAAFSKVQSGVSQIPDKFKSITNSAKSLCEDFSGLGSAIVKPLSNTKIGEKANEISNSFNGMKDKIGQSVAGLGQNIDNKFGNIFSKTSGKISSFNGYLSTIGSALSPITSKLGGFSTAFMTAFSKGFNIATFAGVAIAGLGLIQQGFGDKLSEMILNFQEKGPTLINTLASGIIEAIPNLIAMGGLLITQLLNAITINLPTIVESGFGIIAALVSGIATQLPVLIPMAIDLIMTMVTALIGNIGLLIDAGIELLTSLVSGIILALPNLTEQIPLIIAGFVSTIISNLPKIVKTGIQLLVSLCNGIINAIPNLISMLPEVISSIKNAFVEQDWGQLGKNIIEGLINGLKSMLSNLKNSIINIATSVKDSFKNLLGIHSPSRVFMQYGVYTDEGYAIGIEKGRKGIYKQLDSLRIPETFEQSQLPSTSSILSTNTAPLSQTRTDMSGLGDYIVAVSTDQFSQMANALERGISGMRMTANGREVGRFVSNLGFSRVGV